MDAKPTLTTAFNPREAVAPRRPSGTPGMLTDRVLVQASVGSQLNAILPHVDQDRGGLVLGRGRMTNANNLRSVISDLPNRGFNAPVVFDSEGYRRHTATTDAPFRLDYDGLFTEPLEHHLTRQRNLGAHVALTPTGFIRTDNVDALEAAAEQADRLERDDFMFTAPLDVAILDRLPLAERVWHILNGVRAPVALILASQFDPLDKKAAARVTALRALAAGPANVAVFRTDFNALDLLCHGSFTGAIGSGGSMRHATGPGERARSFDPDNESPSVLYERLGSWWRGDKIAREHGRMPAPTCDCAVCDSGRITRFQSRDDSDDARAHGVIIWQRWAKLIIEQRTIYDRAAFWKRFCQTCVDEHGILAEQLGRPKSLSPRPALRAWARLPS